MPHLSPRDPAAQSAGPVISPECLSGVYFLSCLPSYMLPSQTALAAAAFFQILSSSVLGMNYGL